MLPARWNFAYPIEQTDHRPVLFLTVFLPVFRQTAAVPLYLPTVSLRLAPSRRLPSHWDGIRIYS